MYNMYVHKTMVHMLLIYSLNILYKINDEDHLSKVILMMLLVL